MGIEGVWASWALANGFLVFHFPQEPLGEGSESHVPGWTFSFDAAAPQEH